MHVIVPKILSPSIITTNSDDVIVDFLRNLGKLDTGIPRSFKCINGTLNPQQRDLGQLAASSRTHRTVIRGFYP